MSPFELIDAGVQRYCEEHTTPESDLLYRLDRETNIEVLNPRMLSGQMQGLLLSMVSKMLRPRRILEIGTYTGYSAICLAEGLASDGLLHTIEADAELEDRIRQYVGACANGGRIILHIGDALQVAADIDETWDLVFVDAAKQDYVQYYEMLLPKLRKGGFLLADNTLWGGKVVAGGRHDKDTCAILEFNDRVQHDRRVRNLLLPFRDGMTFIEKL